MNQTIALQRVIIWITEWGISEQLVGMLSIVEQLFYSQLTALNENRSYSYAGPVTPCIHAQIFKIYRSFLFLYATV